MMRRLAARLYFAKGLFGALSTAVLALWVTPIAAQQAPPSARDVLQEITVTARKVSMTDEEVTAQVETALHSDRYIFSDHVTITSRNGVITLRGIATDYWDVIAMKRLVRRIPGVKRVVDDIAVSLGD
jgi:osmotically-inducible protein OsmY